MKMNEIQEKLEHLKSIGVTRYQISKDEPMLKQTTLSAWNRGVEPLAIYAEIFNKYYERKVREITN